MKDDFRVLITNHHLNEFRGSETATYTLAHALRRNGVEPSIVTSHLGRIGEILLLDGFDVTSSLSDWSEREFDVFFLSSG